MLGIAISIALSIVGVFSCSHVHNDPQLSGAYIQRIHPVVHIGCGSTDLDDEVTLHVSLCG